MLLLVVAVSAMDQRRVAVGADGSVGELPGSLSLAGLGSAADYEGAAEKSTHVDLRAFYDLRRDDPSPEAGSGADAPSAGAGPSTAGADAFARSMDPDSEASAEAPAAAELEADPANAPQRWRTPEMTVDEAHGRLKRLVPAPGSDDMVQSNIPYQLFLTAKYDTLADSPEVVQANVHRILDLNKNIKVVFFNDVHCMDYLAQNHEHLVSLFHAATHGPFKSDICRTAWLADNGGWYMDFDIDMRMPFVSIVTPTTTFFAPWTTGANGDVLNALMGVATGSPIMKNAVEWLSGPDGREGCLRPDGVTCGTLAIKKALALFYYSCGLKPPTRHAGPDELDACGEQVRMAKEVDLADPIQRQEMTQEDPNIIEQAITGRNISNFRGKKNAKNHFRGLDYALIFPGPPSFVVGYSRFDACAEWGCEKSKEPTDDANGVATPSSPSDITQNDLSGSTQFEQRLSPTWYNSILDAAGFGFGDSAKATANLAASKPAAAPAQSWFARFFPGSAFEQNFAFLETHGKWY